MDYHPEGSKQRPFKNRNEALARARLDSGVPSSAHCLVQVPETYMFPGLTVDHPIISDIYPTQKAYKGKINDKEQMIAYVAIQDHYLGHLFDDGTYEPAHIHATKVKNVNMHNPNGTGESRKPTTKTEVSHTDRIEGCLEHYYYVEQDDEKVTPDNSKTNDYEKNRAKAYKRLREARNKLSTWSQAVKKGK